MAFDSVMTVSSLSLSAGILPSGLICETRNVEGEYANSGLCMASQAGRAIAALCRRCPRERCCRRDACWTQLGEFKSPHASFIYVVQP
jgi:hypothetical protein